MDARQSLLKRFRALSPANTVAVAGILLGVVFFALFAFAVFAPEDDEAMEHGEKTAAEPPPLLPLTAPPPVPHLEAVATPAPRRAAASASREAIRTPAPAARLLWPTPLPVTPQTPWAQIAQASASGDPGTGLFGLHRNSGSKFHEGLDIRASARDRRGEPVDVVRAAIPGVVVHYAATPNGPYGRYVVLWHSEPGLRFYTLYAHMRSLAPDLRKGEAVDAGRELGGMGRSENGRMFPKERAHLHFEVGVRLSDSFGTWYSKQREFNVPNLQGVWNGINLSGIDPWPFLQAGLASNSVPSLLAQLRKEPTAFTVWVSTNRVPGYVRENPALLAGPLPVGLAGWKIEFSWHGLPLRWTPLILTQIKAKNGVQNFLIQPGSDADLMRKATLRGLLGKRQKNGSVLPGRSMSQVIGILFE
jgi:murein DD-endopeptidase MepM/ murein hydrolase activator NlpD